MTMVMGMAITLSRQLDRGRCRTVDVENRTTLLRHEAMAELSMPAGDGISAG